MSTLNLYWRKSKVSTILILQFILFLSNPVSANIFKPFYSKLERDYLAEAVSSDLKYFLISASHLSIELNVQFSGLTSEFSG